MLLEGSFVPSFRRHAWIGQWIGDGEGGGLEDDDVFNEIVAIEKVQRLGQEEPLHDWAWLNNHSMEDWQQARNMVAGQQQSPGGRSWQQQSWQSWDNWTWQQAWLALMRKA